MDTYSEIKNYPCEYCDRKFKTLYYVVNHMRKIHCVKITRKDLANYRLKRNDVSSEQQDENVCQLESIVEVGETTLLKSEYPSECSSSIENAAEDTSNEVVGMNNSTSSRMSSLKRSNRKQKVARAIGEITSTKPSDTVCPHCGKECYHRSRLIIHITLRHDLNECDVCGISLVGKRQVWYHKVCLSQSRLKIFDLNCYFYSYIF